MQNDLVEFYSMVNFLQPGRPFGICYLISDAASKSNTNRQEPDATESEVKSVRISCANSCLKLSTSLS